MSTFVKRSSPAPTEPSAAQPEMTSTTGCLVHAFWMMLGNGILFMLAIIMYQQQPWPPTWRDAAYLCAVAALILARWLDFRVFHGATASGEPATLAHFWRYVALLLPLVLLVWCAAHFLPKIAS